MKQKPAASAAKTRKDAQSAMRRPRTSRGSRKTPPAAVETLWRLRRLQEILDDAPTTATAQSVLAQVADELSRFPLSAPKRVGPLDSTLHCRQEMSRVYRLARLGQLPIATACKLAFILSSTCRVIEGDELAAEIAKLREWQERVDGGKRSPRPRREGNSR